MAESAKLDPAELEELEKIEEDARYLTEKLGHLKCEARHLGQRVGAILEKYDLPPHEADDGPQSENLERYRRARAEREELALQRDREMIQKQRDLDASKKNSL